MKVIRNPTAHQVVKHVVIRLKYLRGMYTKNKIELIFSPTEEQKADVFTKGFNGKKIKKFREDIGFDRG